MQNLLIGDKNGTESEFALFDLKGQVYGVESKYILEITKLLNLENPEKLPVEIVGILEYGSLFINIVDLRSILDLEADQYTIDNQILIVTTEESIMGLVIDKVLDIVKISDSKIQPPPYLNQNSYTKGLCTLDDKNIIILNLASIENRIKSSFETQNFSTNKQELFPQDTKSKEILANRSLQLHKKFQTEQLSIYSDNEKGITFRIEQEIYCIDIAKIKNFYKLRVDSNITKVPNTPSFIIGLLNFKGDFIATIDLLDYLNQGKTKITESSIVIIIDAGDYMLGILADEIGQRMDITEELERSSNNFNERRPEIVSFVKDEIVYSILLVEELARSERLRF